VASPLTQLRAASRRVARGDAAYLNTTSNMVEIVELSRDLELMRGELVGVAQSLRAEIRQRQIEQAERATLESQLRHEQRLATIGTFAGGLAHEFNNILVPLILYTEESLEDAGAEHPLRANLERILKAASRAADLIQKLLAFARPIAERQPEPVDLAAVTNEALDLSQALMPPNIELMREIGIHDERVLGDATLLSQVVLNLCSNAIHAMRDGGGTLSVSVLPQEAANGTGGIKDTGRGMNPETQERIFEPFFSARGAGEGLGLGLSIVHGIVASMGGRMTVASQLGAGTEFLVEFPAILPAAPGEVI
jgi:signal transduction histidine kinase